MSKNDFLDTIQRTDDILYDIRAIIETSQNNAYKAVNHALIQRNWLIGYRITQEELNGQNRAEYGAEVIKRLSIELTELYGKGFTKSNLYSYSLFFKTFPQIFQTPSGKSERLLSWSHYAALLQVKDKTARDWYEKEAAKQTWSVRTLQRNISTQYYYRLLKSQNKEPVFEEMKEKTSKYQTDKYEFIKNPVIAEFLGMSSNSDYTESELEKSIITNIQKFLMELGIVLCSDTDEDIARYSVMHGSEQLFASKYKLYLPAEEELRAEIEAQKAFFYLQHEKPEEQL